MSETKIRSLDALAVELDAMRRSGKTVVHCHGCFDLLHIGHIKHLQAARRMGDVLIVTMTPDRYVNKGPGRPVFGRAAPGGGPGRAGLRGLRGHRPGRRTAVDGDPAPQAGLLRQGTGVRVISRARPRGCRPRSTRCTRSGGQMRFTARGGLLVHRPPDDVHVGAGGRVTRAHGASHGWPDGAPAVERARDLDWRAGRLPSVCRTTPAAFIDAFRTRHSRRRRAGRVWRHCEELRALVIGEAIIDEYRYCVPLGKSPKEAIVTTREVRQERHAGGVLACANHVAGFCRSVDVVTALGAEASEERFVRANLRPNVTARFVIRPDAPTITKRRYMWEPVSGQDVRSRGHGRHTPPRSRARGRVALGTWTARCPATTS